MICVVLEGRLGNQLFQYAFIYAASRRLNTSFYLDKSIENFMLPKYFEVRNDFFSPLDNRVFSINGYKNIFRIHARRAFYHTISSIIFKEKKITSTKAFFTRKVILKISKMRSELYIKSKSNIRMSLKKFKIN